MNKREAKILSEWLFARNNPLRCDCKDCKRIYKSKQAALIELAESAIKKSKKKSA